jgi:hypothetical protein
LVLVGIAVTAIRAARFVRRERIKENQIKAMWMTEVQKAKKDEEAEAAELK